MLTHQSNVDAATCFFAIILLIQPLNWIPRIYILDTVICHLWNGQFIYWYAVFISGTSSLMSGFEIELNVGCFELLCTERQCQHRD